MTTPRLHGPEVKALQKKVIEKGIYLSVGIALQDADGKRWNAQIVIDPQGRIIAIHRKIYLTKEKGFTETGTEHKVFDVKGLKMGICICADGTDRKNLQALVDNGAQLLYGPHANTTGGTISGRYKFRSAWGGPEGLDRRDKGPPPLPHPARPLRSRIRSARRGCRRQLGERRLVHRP